MKTEGKSVFTLVITVLLNSRCLFMFESICSISFEVDLAVHLSQSFDSQPESYGTQVHLSQTFFPPLTYLWL